LKKLLFILVAVLITCLSVYADDYSNPEDSVPIITDDGPHVYWKNDSTAIVFYWCENQKVEQIFTVNDTLKFSGFCTDTNIVYTIPRDKPLPSDDIYSDVSKIFVLSDIHGEYEYFVNILITAKIIDDNLHWIWDDGYLVIDGDVFDRGELVTECLWLIYNLEHEAMAAGGRVHLTLGNHEIMPLRNDLRYINEKYLDGICRKTRIQYPDLFGSDTELGRWLRSKHTALKINDILFVHGGLYPNLIDSGYTITRINQTARDGIDISSLDLRYNPEVKLMYGSFGPYWYRGFHYEMENRYPQITEPEVDKLLSYFDVATIVVGHTGVDQIIGLYNNKILAVDIPFDELLGLQGLLIENGKYYRVHVDGTRELIK